LRDGINTSSIMVGNAASIMQREAGPRYARLTAKFKPIPTRFCHDRRNDRAK
jgi:hypothetical protein